MLSRIASLFQIKRHEHRPHLLPVRLLERTDLVPVQPHLLAVDHPRLVLVGLQQRLERLGAQLAVFLAVGRVEQVIAGPARFLRLADEPEGDK